MKKYRIDVKIIGHSEVVVCADDYESAKELAANEVFKLQTSDLRWKEARFQLIEETATNYEN